MKLVDAYGSTLKLGDIVYVFGGRGSKFEILTYNGVTLYMVNTDPRRSWNRIRKKPKNVIKLEIEDLI